MAEAFLAGLFGFLIGRGIEPKDATAVVEAIRTYLGFEPPLGLTGYALEDIQQGKQANAAVVVRGKAYDVVALANITKQSCVSVLGKKGERLEVAPTIESLKLVTNINSIGSVGTVSQLLNIANVQNIANIQRLAYLTEIGIVDNISQIGVLNTIGQVNKINPLGSENVRIDRIFNVDNVGTLNLLNTVNLIKSITSIDLIKQINLIDAITQIKTIKNATISQNIIRNPSFETGTPEEWSTLGTGTTITSAKARDGIYSALIPYTTPETSVLSQLLPPYLATEITIGFSLFTTASQQTVDVWFMFEDDTLEQRTISTELIYNRWYTRTVQPTTAKRLAAFEFLNNDSTRASSLYIDAVSALK